MTCRSRVFLVTAVKWTGDNFDEIKEFFTDEECIQKDDLVIIDEYPYKIDTYFVRTQSGDIVDMSPDEFDKYFELV